MTENNKRLILIIVGALVIILAIFIVWWQFFRDVEEPVVITNINTPAIVNTNIETIEVNNNTNQPEEVVLDEKLSMNRLASIFTERFGSYTSESEFKNTLDLKVYMTDSLQKWADSYLAAQPEQSPGGEYVAVVTKVISNKTTTSDDSSGTVELITQRTETTGQEENIYYQDITLELVYNNEVWLVNKVTWGDKQ